MRAVGGFEAMSRPEFVIFAHSGDYDRLYQVATLAASAAANGDEVHIILFFNAMRRFVEDDLDNISFPDSYGEEGGLIEERMRQSRASSVGELIDTARQLGKLKVYGCAAQVKFLGYSTADVEEVVDEVISLPNFLKRTANARTKLFI